VERWRLAIDVAITSALSKSATRHESPCEEYAATQKHGKYDKGFADTNYSFCAMVWETLGALNSEGEEVLRQIFRFAAKQLGCEFSSYCGRAWARISCCLQRSVGQAILNRIDGREFRDPLILAEPDTFLAPLAPYSATHSLPSGPHPHPNSTADFSSFINSTTSLPSPPTPLFSPPPFSPLANLPAYASSPRVASSLPQPPLVPGVLAIKADGHCCYHLAGVIGALCKNQNVLARGSAVCSDDDLARVRGKEGEKKAA
jgi:hypothetical protein